MLKKFHTGRIVVSILETILVIFWQKKKKKKRLVFCNCHKNIHEAELKGSVLMVLLEEISRQPGIDSAM